jgi:transketolase N-terminal domain/subunit
MTAVTPNTQSTAPAFCEGIQYFGESLPGFETYGKTAAIADGSVAIADPTDPTAVYQTLLAADALRYLIVQVTASKASGHPGGFASQVEAYAALVMLGYKNIMTEVGHHAPGFYSAMFLDRSLEEMGIETVQQLRDRFREKHGLLGHLSGLIPGILAPAGPLGQGQHFAMSAALLHRDKLFPFTLGDGGLGEPYIVSAMAHFHTAYPTVTNFLPVLVWNGFSQEHHSMVSTKSNEEMVAYWRGNGFEEVVLIDAKDYDDQNQPGDYVDSTAFSFDRRLEFTQAVLVAVDRAHGSDPQATQGGRRSREGSKIPQSLCPTHFRECRHHFCTQSSCPLPCCLGHRANQLRTIGRRACQQNGCNRINLAVGRVGAIAPRRICKGRIQNFDDGNGSVGRSSGKARSLLYGNQRRWQRSVWNRQHQPGFANHSPRRRCAV